MDKSKVRKLGRVAVAASLPVAPLAAIAVQAVTAPAAQADGLFLNCRGINSDTQTKWDASVEGGDYSYGYVTGELDDGNGYTLDGPKGPASYFAENNQGFGGAATVQSTYGSFKTSYFVRAQGHVITGGGDHSYKMSTQGCNP